LKRTYDKQVSIFRASIKNGASAAKPF